MRFDATVLMALILGVVLGIIIMLVFAPNSGR